MFRAFQNNKLLTQTLQVYIENKLQLPDGTSYAYSVINKKNPYKLLVVSNYPGEWVDFYRTHHLQLVDPVVLTAFKRFTPFTWDENITLLSDLKFSRIFSLSRKYNILNGITFVVHDHINNLGLLSVIARNAESSPSLDLPAQDRAKIQLVLTEIHGQMYHLLNAAGSARKPVKRCGEEGLFSPREHEILYWASMGKTYGEIASIVAISLSTVKFHMGNVVNKLGVSNARQAIRLGMELNLIKPLVSAANVQDTGK